MFQTESRITCPFRRLFSRIRPPRPSPSPVLPDVKPSLLERLTPGALKSLSVAQEEAKSLGHRHIGTEHLLLALTKDPEFTAYSVLEQLGAVPSTVRAQVLQVLETGPGPGPGPGLESEALALTPRARLALELAHRASIRINVPETGTEHLLIGLAGESEGIGAKTLGKFSISAKDAEHQVTTNLDRGNARHPRDQNG
ncbi:ATP-dependent Clp protease ATP-binding subunit ClpA [Arthrobacter sp. B3I9]|uniref:Clp protease N-terminal domain-containing protein n=1 Tax=Arthrobacter sp. B3I9 TaxID=3042270 RepID=UPI002794E429|nr:Clp protease N-terminal domain-containing protein [Arthrobacter sp. B3I9]MDQ0848749.1 ATP-dependent Clp protease ATP-binding subunit ClpA [Arthrobacter sp. B3I9]